MREIRKSGRVKRTAPVVTSSQTTAEAPMIGLAALLQLVDWYHARGLSNQQGGLSCVDVEPPLSPPAPDRANPAERPTPVLAGPARRPARAHSACSQPRRGPTTHEASDGFGADA